MFKWRKKMAYIFLLIIETAFFLDWIRGSGSGKSGTGSSTLIAEADLKNPRLVGGIVYIVYKGKVG